MTASSISDDPPRRGRALIPVAAIVAALAMAGGAQAHSTTGAVSCGATITRDTTLKADLTNCPGDGLVIGADNITLDLNGHTIDGGQGKLQR